MAEIKYSESNPDSDSEPNSIAAYNGRQIIDADPTTTIATAQIQLEDLEESEVEECLFHSQMWVKGIPLHFFLQWNPKEPDLNRICQEIGSSENTTPATLQNRLAKLRTRYLHY